MEGPGGSRLSPRAGSTPWATSLPTTTLTTEPRSQGLFRAARHAATEVPMQVMSAGCQVQGLLLTPLSHPGASALFPSVPGLVAPSLKYTFSPHLSASSPAPAPPHGKVFNRHLVPPVQRGTLRLKHHVVCLSGTNLAPNPSGTLRSSSALPLSTFDCASCPHHLPPPVGSS